MDNIKNITSIRILQDEGNVLVLKNGVLVLEMPWRQAEEISKAMWSVARMCDRLQNINAVAADATIMKNAGVPRSFTDAFVGIPHVTRLAFNKIEIT